MTEARLKSARILVVDDEVASTCLLTNFLSRFGYNHVRAINDPLDTFDNIEEFQPDLILLDLFMTGMDGFQIMERLKAMLPQEFCLPVLALSGDATSQNKRRALAAGATDMLNKPFDPSEMLMRIRNLLHTRFLYLELQEQNRGLEGFSYQSARMNLLPHCRNSSIASGRLCNSNVCALSARWRAESCTTLIIP